MLLAGMALLTFVGCLSKPTTVKFAQKTVVNVITVTEYFDTEEITAFPKQAVAKLESELSNFNVAVVPVSDDSLISSFAKHRDIKNRIKVIANYQQERQKSVPTLFIEAKARYFSQLGGHYRWVVSGRVTLLNTNGEELDSATKEFSVPVFLKHHHQRENQAIIEATSSIEEEIDILLYNHIRQLSH